MGISLPSPLKTSADVTYYVRPGGNDGNIGTGNSNAGAFKTIQRAINAIPQIVNHNITINVGVSGTYTENLAVLGFLGSGSINITTPAPNVAQSSNYILAGTLISQRNTCRVSLSGFRFAATSQEFFITVRNSSEIFVQYCSSINVTNPKQPGIFIESSKVYINSCVITSKEIGLQVHYNSEVLIQNCSGTDNNIAHYVGYGGRLQISGPSISAATTSASAYVSSVDGGMVTINAQGVVNPWGDNTTNSRSRCEAVATGSISFSQSTWTKIIFDRKDYDNQGEYNATTGRFTAKAAGVYLITASVALTGISSGKRTLMDLYRSGIQVWRLQDSSTGLISDMSLCGTTTMYMNAGDYIEIIIYVDSSNNLTEPGSKLNVIKIA